MKYLHALWLFIALPAQAVEGDVAIRWTAPDTNNNGLVEVVGLDSETLASLARRPSSASTWPEVFAIYAEQGGIDLFLPPMAGSYQVRDQKLQFRPQFSFEREVSYRAVFKPSGTGKTSASSAVTSTFRLPHKPIERTAVVSAIFPSTDQLPENLLKFYVQFSAPMSRGHIYDHIHLQDDSGKSVELPFLEIDEELWDPSMTRLTLFLDPGRIKRGVTPLEEVGPSLRQGHGYMLRIDDKWLDANGAPLKNGLEKTFRVTSPDREPIDVGKWKLRVPSSRSTEPLDVSFAEPLDHALARRMIRILGPSGAVLAGDIKLSDRETGWHFTPSQPWRAGSYRLVVQNTIEDLAGNNIGKPFEVDLFDKVDRSIKNLATTIPFRVR